MNAVLCTKTSTNTLPLGGHTTLDNEIPNHTYTGRMNENTDVTTYNACDVRALLSPWDTPYGQLN